MLEIKSLLDIAPAVDTFFVDMYGVLWNGQRFFDGAIATMRALHEQGKIVCILSNATTVSDMMEQKYATHDFIKGRDYDMIVTSGDVLQEKLEKDDFLSEVTGKCDGTYYIIGRQNDLLLKSVLNREVYEIDFADGVYLGSLKKNGIAFETMDPFLPEMEKIRTRKLPIICANPDYYAIGNDQKYICPGLLAQWFQEKGNSVYWIGKPYREIYEFALRKTHSDPTRTVMVGDTLRTDIAGGLKAGLQTVLITQTGMTAEAVAHGKTLAQLMQEQGVVPNYLLTQVR